MVETWPADLWPRESSFYLLHNTSAFESPLTRTVQVLARPGARWVATAEFFLPRVKARRLDALLARLRGRENSVALFDWDRWKAGGSRRLHSDFAAAVGANQPFADGTRFTDGTGFGVSGRPLAAASGAARGARALPIDGLWPHDTALVQGDYLGLGGALYMLTADATADGSGMATVSIEPALRAPVQAGDPIVIERPTGIFRLTADDGAANPSDAAGMYRYSLSFVEVLP